MTPLAQSDLDQFKSRDVYFHFAAVFLLVALVRVWCPEHPWLAVALAVLAIVFRELQKSRDLSPTRDWADTRRDVYGGVLGGAAGFAVVWAVRLIL